MRDFSVFYELSLAPGDISLFSDWLLYYFGSSVMTLNVNAISCLKSLSSRSLRKYFLWYQQSLGRLCLPLLDRI